MSDDHDLEEGDFEEVTHPYDFYEPENPSAIGPLIYKDPIPAKPMEEVVKEEEAIEEEEGYDIDNCEIYGGKDSAACWNAWCEFYGECDW